MKAKITIEDKKPKNLTIKDIPAGTVFKFKGFSEIYLKVADKDNHFISLLKCSLYKSY